MTDVLDPTPPIETPAPQPSAADVLATLAAVQAELNALKADAATKAEAEATARAEASAQAKADADAKLTEGQRTQAELAELKAKLATQEQAQVEATRTAMLDALGVDPNYRLVFPQGDARDPKVKAAIEKFAADHPRLLTRQPGPPQPNVPNLQSKLQGRPISKLVNAEAMRQSYDAMNDTVGR